MSNAPEKKLNTVPLAEGSELSATKAESAGEHKAEPVPKRMAQITMTIRVLISDIKKTATRITRKE